MNKTITILAMSTVLVVTGCSKKTDYAESEAIADAVTTNESPVAADASAEAAMTNENAGAIQSVQNPSEILSTQQSALEQNRKLVKSSQLTFEVDELQKTTHAIEQKLLEVNGYIETKSIEYQVQDYETRNKLDGTVDVFEKVKPVADLTVRVPNAQVTAFLNSVLPLMKNFNHQSYEAKRYELKLLEEKMRTANESYGASNGVANQLQRLTQQEVQDRLNYSTISLQYFQAAQVRQGQDLNINRIANIHSDPFFSRVWESIKTGFVALREVIIWLILIWPMYIILIVIYLIYRKVKRKNTTV